MGYDKPFKTYDQQIKILKDKYHLLIENEDLAKQLLSTFSYYDLVNGYKDILMENEHYIPGTSIEQVHIFHMINKDFQSILFKYSVYIENAYKNSLAYLLSKNFGVHQDEYLNFSNFINPKNKKDRMSKEKTLSKIKKTIDNTYTGNPTKFYRKKHNHIPPWIIFKNVSFGDSIDLYRQLKSKDKKELLGMLINYSGYPISTSNIPMLEALTIVRKFRNVIAHNLKFITFESTQTLKSDKLPQVMKETLLYPEKNVTGAYSMLCSIILLINSAHLFRELIFDLTAVCKKYQPSFPDVFNRYLKNIAFPVNFIDRMKKFSKMHYNIKLE